MPKWSPLAACAGAGLTALVAVALVAPASADVYAWRTQDGVYAYTDNPERIPARYADQAVKLDSEDTNLEGYARLTRTDPAATQAARDGLARRLEALRRMNGLAPQEGPRAGTRAAGARTVTVATGNASAPTVDVDVVDDTEPVVVESILTKERGSVSTRHSTLVRQGDRTLALIKGRRRHIDLNQDIHDEDDLIE